VLVSGAGAVNVVFGKRDTAPVDLAALGDRGYGQLLGLPCGGGGGACRQSLLTIGIRRAKPITLAATMSVPGIQSSPAITMIPKISADASAKVRSAVWRTFRLNSSFAVTVRLLDRKSPLIVAAEHRAVIGTTPCHH
jgi:hypothetical protein